MKLGEHFINILGGLDSVPSIQYLWKEAQEYVVKNDVRMIKKYQNLILVLHNSFVSPETKMGDGVSFGYGGIGVVLHKNCVIGNGVSISQNVTLGGTPGSVSKDESGKNFFVPIVKDNCYIACGSKVLGVVVLEKFTVIGANSVVLSNTEPFSVYVGNPARKVKNIRKENCLKYRGFFRSLQLLNDIEYTLLFPS
ncbi:serine O-acetyltransferase [Nitrincola nitratireducens]|uniref:Serine acetyltransferase n=1 Tax=Nitrincola nitratireducens TaxID=1229521 RepID=W9V0Z6_9GAMM|nr:hypothetical protein [Nitrincola nitratireducens]EXJ10631.1 Serine acetyltransferase [Nitrincola nitratireducens]